MKVDTEIQRTTGALGEVKYLNNANANIFAGVRQSAMPAWEAVNKESAQADDG